METGVRGGIARQIQLLRLNMGLSQAEFAKLIGTTQSAVSRLESADYGRVSIQTLLKIALVADVALLVRFVSFRAFLFRMRDVTDKESLPVPFGKERALVYSINIPPSKTQTVFSNFQTPPAQPQSMQKRGPSDILVNSVIGKAAYLPSTENRRVPE